MFQEDLYNRQSNLNLRTYQHVAIIGVGGIGSWVALFAALTGKIKRITMWDPDKVEITNLNRSPFRLQDVGKYKVDAISQIIDERRISNSLDLIGIKEKVLENTFKIIYQKNELPQVIIDCRDGLFLNDYEHLKLRNPNIKVIKLSYDGLSVTYDSDFLNRKVWGETVGGYTIDPSFLCPCTYLATAVITDLLTCKANKWGEEVFVKKFLTFNMNESLETINDYALAKKAKELAEKELQKLQEYYRQAIIEKDKLITKNHELVQQIEDLKPKEKLEVQEVQSTILESNTLEEIK